MAAFTKAKRQQVIDDYLAASGNNVFHAAEFVDWLADNPDHEAYDWFYGTDDATAAREYRVNLARRMASGLRIVARIEETKSNVVHVTVREYPAYVSPMDRRNDGGGYNRFDPHDPADMAELRKQGAIAMRTWLNRYRGAFEAEGVDLLPFDEIAALAAPVKLSA